jgi:hypothetical protein
MERQKLLERVPSHSTKDSGDTQTMTLNSQVHIRKRSLLRGIIQLPHYSAHSKRQTRPPRRLLLSCLVRCMTCTSIIVVCNQVLAWIALGVIVLPSIASPRELLLLETNTEWVRGSTRLLVMVVRTGLTFKTFTHGHSFVILTPLEISGSDMTGEK